MFDMTSQIKAPCGVVFHGANDSNKNGLLSCQTKNIFKIETR
jgi:hypothetical protein